MLTASARSKPATSRPSSIAVAMGVSAAESFAPVSLATRSANLRISRFSSSTWTRMSTPAVRLSTPVTRIALHMLSRFSGWIVLLDPTMDIVVTTRTNPTNANDENGTLYSSSSAPVSVEGSTAHAAIKGWKTTSAESALLMDLRATAAFWYLLSTR